MNAARPIAIALGALFLLGTAHCARDPLVRTSEQLQVGPRPEPGPIHPRPEPQPRPKPTHTGDPPEAPAPR